MTETQAPAGFVSSQFLTDKGEIERVFRIFRDQCSPVQLRFGRVEDEYTARVLEVTAHQFLLEDIRPRNGMKLMRDQEPFSLAGRVDGIYARVSEVRVLKTAEDRGIPYFVLNLPTELLYQQRRRAARFRLPLSVSRDSARLTLHRPERALSGNLVDISAGGCRAVFDVKSDPEIQSDEVVERSEIDVPNLLSLTLRTVIRHCSYNRKKGQVACGIEFTEMHVRDRRRLEQFIQKIAKITDPA
jgi:c-di-GMP-binding flagellar brake protein YcgR